MKRHEGLDQIPPQRRPPWVANEQPHCCLRHRQALPLLQPPQHARAVFYCRCHYISTDSPCQSLLSSACGWCTLAGTRPQARLAAPQDRVPLLVQRPDVSSFEQHPGSPGSFDVCLMTLSAQNMWDRPVAWCPCLSIVHGIGFWIQPHGSHIPTVTKEAGCALRL